MASIRRSPQESVDWNPVNAYFLPSQFCRSPQESVDWNSLVYNIIRCDDVALPRRAWIEIVTSLTVSATGIVALPRRAWIEILNPNYIIFILLCRSPQESVDWNRLMVHYKQFSLHVALPRRAWIEIHTWSSILSSILRRSPQESVDWNL